MSRASLYLDEDVMRRSLVFSLRSRHIDVLTAHEANMVNRADQDHLETASSHGRVLYTFNMSDYCALHQSWLAEGRNHAGIVVAPQQRYGVGEELRRLMRLIGKVSAEEMRNRLEFLSTWG